MKKILIVEASKKVKTISKLLDKNFIVTATNGHIRDLPVKKLGIKIEDCKITIDYENMSGKTKTIKDLIKICKDANEIYLATDPDREGEIISLHVKEIIEENLSKKKDLKIKRITYNEISKKAISEGLKNARDIDENLVSAQQARRILDRLVGYQVSPILWKKVSKGLSAGRVQSVALKLVCIRENEIKNFKIEEYWSIHSNFSVENVQLNSELSEINEKKDFKIKNENEAKDIKDKVLKKKFKITSIKDTKRIRKPYAPFITSTLQQAAYNILGFNVQQTMSCAQSLYEGVTLKDGLQALITYMRTDSTRVSDEALKSLKEFIKSTYGKDYLPSTENVYVKSSSAQDAHEAIRPIDVNILPEDIKSFVEKDLYLLYDLIWKRFVASQMTNVEYLNRQILFNDDKKDFTFKTSGSTITFDGFLKVYENVEEDDDKNKIPPLVEKESKVDILSANEKQHFTQPPARYSEATLVKELESNKIGRPSTYASILKTIRDRLYTYLDDKKRFVPTELGFIVSNLLEENMTKIMDLDFTAQMEDKLDSIADGKSTRDDVICDFYKDFSIAVKNFEGKKFEKTIESTNIKCKNDDCDGTLIIKMGKSGQFVGCSNYPKCSFTSNFKRNEDGSIELIEIKAEEPLDIKCGECGKNLIKRRGRFGEFIACPGYPECKYIHKTLSKALCPKCCLVPLMKRNWKNTVFWGCSSYPKCRYGINGDVIEKNCPKCNFPFLKKNLKDNSLICAGENCEYKEELKEN